MAMIEREINVIASLSEGLSLTERRKNAELMSKLASILLSYRAQVQTLETEKEPVIMVYNQFKIILQEALQENKSEESKKLVTNILTKLQNSVK